MIRWARYAIIPAGIIGLTLARLVTDLQRAWIQVNEGGRP